MREAYEKKVASAAAAAGGAEGAAAATTGKEGLLTREEAEAVLDDCMKVLFYRDARSLNKVSFRSLPRLGLLLHSSSRDMTWE